MRFLPVVDANYRRRAIAESLVTIATVIATHLKIASGPVSATVVIRGVCERRTLLGVTGSTGSTVAARPEGTSMSSVKKRTSLIPPAGKGRLGSTERRRQCAG
jgi:hypothetical protein